MGSLIKRLSEQVKGRVPGLHLKKVEKSALTHGYSRGNELISPLIQQHTNVYIPICYSNRIEQALVDYNMPPTIDNVNHANQ
jgi:hypothetical protein